MQIAIAVRPDVLTVTADGAYRRAVRNVTVVVLPTPGKRGLLLGVGDRIASLERRHRARPGAVELAAFDAQQFAPVVAANVTMYLALQAYHHFHPGIRTLVSPDRIRLALGWPEWGQVGEADARPFLFEVAKAPRLANLQINGRDAIRQTRGRRLLGRKPRFDQLDR